MEIFGTNQLDGSRLNLRGGERTAIRAFLRASFERGKIPLSQVFETILHMATTLISRSGMEFVPGFMRLLRSCQILSFFFMVREPHVHGA